MIDLDILIRELEDVDAVPYDRKSDRAEYLHRKCHVTALIAIAEQNIEVGQKP